MYRVSVCVYVRVYATKRKKKDERAVISLFFFSFFFFLTMNKSQESYRGGSSFESKRDSINSVSQ